MAAIMVADLTIRNEEAFQTYRTCAAKAVAKFGGRYEQAQAWYQSPEYYAALEVRDVALARNLILVDGYREQ